MQSWQSPLGWKREGLAVQARQERERRRGEVVGTCEEVEGRWSEGRWAREDAPFSRLGRKFGLLHHLDECLWQKMRSQEV